MSSNTCAPSTILFFGGIPIPSHDCSADQTRHDHNRLDYIPNHRPLIFCHVSARPSYMLHSRSCCAQLRDQMSKRWSRQRDLVLRTTKSGLVDDFSFSLRPWSWFRCAGGKATRNGIYIDDYRLLGEIEGRHSAVHLCVQTPPSNEE